MQDANLKAVLADYSRAKTLSENENDGTADIMQFGQLLEMLLMYCNEYREYREVCNYLVNTLKVFINITRPHVPGFVQAL